MDNRLGLRPVSKRHRLIAERELNQYGRPYAERYFVQSANSPDQQEPRLVSLPYAFFLDDFGLYRNAYHSLAGLYFQPWNLPDKQRMVLQNMFVLMIAPFGSNEKDLAMCMEDEALKLGAGVLVKINGEVIRLVMFPMAFTGDSRTNSYAT